MLDLEAWGRKAAKSGVNVPFLSKADGEGWPAAFLQFRRS